MAKRSGRADDLLWVNKDANSYSLSNSQHDIATRQAINLHVQVWQNPLPQSRRSRKSAVTSPNMLAYWRHAPLKPKLAGMEHSGEVHERHRACDCPCPKGCQACIPAQKRQSLNMPLSGSPADPFGCSKVAIDVNIHRFLTFFTVVWMPTAFRLDAQVKAQVRLQERPNSSLTDIISGCMSNDMHMYSLLAATTGRMKFVTEDRLDRIDRPEQFLAMAIVNLRQYLEQGSKITQQVIVDMFFLATVEIYSRNIEGARAHLRIIKHLVTKLGGLGYLDLWAREMIWNCDMVAACFHGVIPIFDSLPDPGPLPASRTAQIEADLTSSARGLMGSAFLKIGDVFDLRMRTTIEDVIGVARTVQHFWQFSHAQSCDREWAAERGHALIHRLLSMPALSELSSERFLIQECCRIALTMWLAYMYSVGTTGVPSLPANVQKVRKLMPGNARLLRRCVERVEAVPGKPCGTHDDILLWIISLGLLTSFEDEDSAFFSQRVMLLAKKRKICHYQQLDLLFEPYLWLDRLEQGSGGTLARLISRDPRDPTVSKQLKLGDRRDATVQTQFGVYGLPIVQITNNITGL